MSVLALRKFATSNLSAFNECKLYPFHVFISLHAQQARPQERSHQGILSEIENDTYSKSHAVHSIVGK